MKTVVVLKFAAVMTLSSTIIACANSPKIVADQPSPAAAYVAPAPAIVETPRGPSLTLDDVLFDFEQSSLRAEAHSTVEKAAAYLESNPERTALVEGHTDHTGDDDYNQTLSQARSESIKDALVSLGISESRIETKGLGESSPVADNNTIEGRRANRRSEIIFVAE